MTPPIGGLLHSTKCLCCETPFSARSARALEAAMKSHADYVNATADRVTDPHFDDIRLDALIAS